MKQNAVGLANICILSTMVLVTVSSTVTLYQGHEETLDQMYPYDIQVVQYLTGYDEEVELPASEDVLEQTEEILTVSGRTASYFSWLDLAEGWCWYSGNTFQWETGSQVRLRLITEEDYVRRPSRRYSWRMTRCWLTPRGSICRTSSTLVPCPFR